LLDSLLQENKNIKMGKARKTKSKNGRTDPVGLNGANGHVENTEEKSEEKIMSNIMEQLQSSNPEDKICGCQSLGSLSCLEIINKLILSKKLIRAVAPLVIEKEEMVQLSALGALRNISSINTDTAEEMVNQDIMTPVESFFSNYRNKQIEDLTDNDFEVLNEGVNLLWHLVEASPTASNLFKQSGILEYCLSLLGAPTGPDLAASLLTLLSSATDQNKDVSEKILSHQGILERYLVHPNHQLRISSVLLFTTILEEKVLESSICAKVFEILAESIKQDTRTLVCEVSSAVPDNDEAQMEMDIDGQRNEDSTDSKQFKECLNNLRDQQTAIEILANLCSGGDGENEQWEDEEEDGSENGEDVDDAVEGQTEAVVQVVNPVFVEAVMSLQLMQAILDKANSLPENVQQILLDSAKGKELLKSHTNLRIRSFLCLSNMLTVLSVDDFGGAAALFSTWNSLGTILVQEKNDIQLLDAASSCMRSVTNKICSDKEGKNVMNITQKELEAIVEVGQSIETPEIRMNIVNIIGDISVLLSKTLATGSQEGAEVFKVLVSWLVDGGCKDSDLRVVTESLDKLFDAFTEDYTDNVFFSLNMLSKLKAIENSYKIKLKMQKLELSSDSLAIISDVKLNLRRFIKYKEKRCK